MNNNILIIGLPDSSKTTFLAQLYVRIKKRKGKLRLSKNMDELNIKAIESAVNALANGNATQTTSADDNLEVVLPVTLGQLEFKLICPDYGGEQIRNICDLMEVNQEMQKRTTSSDQWLFFIRPGEIFPEYDLSVTTYQDLQVSRGQELAIPEFSHQSRFIEILQALIHIKGAGIRNLINIPRLFIVLTCWDELNTEKTPEQIILEKLPLLYDLICTNWGKHEFSFIGLSAQEFPLDTMEAKDKYLDELPENYGYLVLPDGKQDKDLTKLIEIAIAR